MNSNNLQRVKKTLENLYVEKQKIDKEKSKKGGKGKSKASLRLEEDNVSSRDQTINWIHFHWFCATFFFLFRYISQATIKEYGQYESYDYDDFMWE